MVYFIVYKNECAQPHGAFLAQKLIPYRYSSSGVVLIGGMLFKKPQGFVVLNRIRMKFGTIVLQVNLR